MNAIDDLRGVSDEQIHQLIHEGKLPDKMKFHRFKQILACNEIIDSMLTRFDRMGFNPADIYYAMLEQTFYSKFALEDMGQGKLVEDINKEIAEDMVKHRAKYPPRIMRENAERTAALMKQEKARRLKALEAVSEQGSPV